MKGGKKTKSKGKKKKSKTRRKRGGRDCKKILKEEKVCDKKSWMKASRKLHPDKGGDAKVMLEINVAWEILKKKHKHLNFNKFNNSKVYNQNAYKKEANNYSKSEEIKNWFISECKLNVLGIVESPIKGAKGNVEFLIVAKN